METRSCGDETTYGGVEVVRWRQGGLGGSRWARGAGGGWCSGQVGSVFVNEVSILHSHPQSLSFFSPPVPPPRSLCVCLRPYLSVSGALCCSLSLAVSLSVSVCVSLRVSSSLSSTFSDLPCVCGFGPPFPSLFLVSFPFTSLVLSLSASLSLTSLPLSLSLSRVLSRLLGHYLGVSLFCVYFSLAPGLRPS